MSNEHQTPLLSTHLEDAEMPEVTEQKSGFLPIETNWFDRLFISVVIWVAMSLLWFRFVEPMGLSIWISNVVAFALAITIIRKG
jgi:predicted small integral membrane protein